MSDLSHIGKMLTEACSRSPAIASAAASLGVTPEVLVRELTGQGLVVVPDQLASAMDSVLSNRKLSGREDIPISFPPDDYAGSQATDDITALHSRARSAAEAAGLDVTSWVISSPSGKQFWSFECGWTDEVHAMLFYGYERGNIQLPVHQEGQAVWERFADALERLQRREDEPARARQS